MVTSTIDYERMLTGVSEGMVFSREAALGLFETDDLASLLQAASTVRDRHKGCTISYSRKVFIPLTTLCRDYCGYCTFRKDPGEKGAHFMTPEDVLRVAEQGRRAGCKEALFSLGDQPERVFPEAREFLQQQGFETTLDYLAAMCKLVLEETGLLPHANPGLMGRDNLLALKETNASLGLMLESVSPRLLQKNEAHWRAPDKVPSLRLKTMEEAGRLQIPFTTGILIGIGETREERVDSLLAIRDLHERYGHIQEVIVQNFRAKDTTRMVAFPEPGMDEMLRTVAVARLILGEEMNLQAPPNLSYSAFPQLLQAGINDWGGVSPVTKDFINPEAPWPHLETLKRKTEAEGYQLRERLAIYPEFIEQPGFVSPAVRERIRALAAQDGLAMEGDRQDVAVA
jgi:FO synthase